LVDSFDEWSYFEVSNGVVSYRFSIDTDLVPLVVSHHWGLRRRSVGGKYDLYCNALSLSLHHFVLDCCGELFVGCQVHHIDGGFINCTRSNLVAVSPREHYMIHNFFISGPLSGLAPCYKPKKCQFVFSLGVFRAGNLKQFLALDAGGTSGRVGGVR
jgi:hypothetical protein